MEGFIDGLASEIGGGMGIETLTLRTWGLPVVWYGDCSVVLRERQ